MGLYRVQYGDSAASIAERFTGDANQARDLVLANPHKKWTDNDGPLQFKEIFIDEILTLPVLWDGSGLSGPLVGLGQGETQATSAFIDKLSTSAKEVAQGLSSKEAEVARATTIANTISSIASNGNVSWDAVVGVAATVATALGTPLAGGVVAALGMGLKVMENVLGDVLGFLKGSSELPPYPVDIAMDNMVIKNMVTTKFIPGKGRPYGFDSPTWMHIIDPNDLKPGSQTWDARGIPEANVGPWWFTGSMWIYGESDFARSCKYTNTTVSCTPPNYENFQYNVPGRALMWMFGVVLNELYEINGYLAQLDAGHQIANRSDLEFRKFFYGLLLRNWESRCNGNVNINDRYLLAGAVDIWNKTHSSEETRTFRQIYPNPPVNYLNDAAQGYCKYEFNISGRIPSRSTSGECECPSRNNQCDWSVTDISWSRTKTFIEFMLSDPYDPVAKIGMPPLVVNTGRRLDVISPSKKLTGIIFEKSDRVGSVLDKFVQLTDKPKATSTGTKVLIGTTVVGAIGAAAIWYHAWSTGRTFLGAAKHVYSLSKNVFKKKRRGRSARENPLAPLARRRETPLLPPGSTPVHPAPIVVRKSSSRRVAYRVDLSGDPYVEAVRMLPDGTAVLYRRRRPMARFRPAKYQFLKIRSSEGALLIYADQLLG